MKKFLVFIVLLAMTTPFIFAEDIEAVAGEANYKIDMKLHNFVEKAYTNTIATEICLPVIEKLKIYIDASFSDNSDMDPKNATGVGGFYNNYLKMYFGIPITDTVHLTILLGGGTAISHYQWSLQNVLSSDNLITDLTGEGQLFFGFGIKLKSALFANVLDNMYIRQNFTFHLNGNGNYYGQADSDKGESVMSSLVGSSVNAVGGETEQSNTAHIVNTTATLGTSEYQNYQYWGMDYSGTIGTGVLFDVGLPKLALAFELGYDINYFAYTKTLRYQNAEYWGRTNDGSANGAITYSYLDTRGEYDYVDLYTTKPSKFYGDVSLKINLQINPNENIQSETWVTPGFGAGSLSWEYYTSENGKSTAFTPDFFLKVGANWKYTFPKYVWIKLDCEWKFDVSLNGFTLDTDTKDLIAAGGSKSVTMFNKMDPGITVGFNLANWSIEAKWAPAIYLPKYTFTYASKKDANGNDLNPMLNDITASGGSGYTSGSSDAGTQNNGLVGGSDSNILNLANWDIGVSVSFPPPTK